METTTNVVSFLPPWLQYIVLAIGIVLIAYLLYGSLTPSKTQALLKASPKFKAYEQVTKLAPLGCPTNYRLADYYIASSSYSVFPGDEVYDYISDSILPLIIKAFPHTLD